MNDETLFIVECLGQQFLRLYWNPLSAFCELYVIAAIHLVQYLRKQPKHQYKSKIFHRYTNLFTIQQLGFDLVHRIQFLLNLFVQVRLSFGFEFKAGTR